MSNIIDLNKSVKTPVSNTQKTFARLRKQIVSLQKNLEKGLKELDEGLKFYFNTIEPEEKVLAALLTETVKIFYKHYKDPSLFSKKEKKFVKGLILNRIEEIILIMSRGGVDLEIRTIFEELEGASYTQVMSEGLDDIKKTMEEMCKDSGIDVDFSSIDPLDSDDEMMRKMMDAMFEAKSNQMSEEEPAPKKSKKELEKEMKRERLEAMQRQGLNGIYKQLAKVLHPDLERDPEQKIQKEGLMKKLTVAYENKDLSTLLCLEMEWMDQSDKQQSEDQLKIYNLVLQEQVDAIKDEINRAQLDPKYLPIHHYLKGAASNYKFKIEERYIHVKDSIEVYQEILDSVKEKNGKKFIKEFITEGMFYNAFNEDFM